VSFFSFVFFFSFLVFRLLLSLPLSLLSLSLLLSPHLDVLQRLEHPQRLVDRAAEREVVDRRVLHDTLAVDDEEAAEGDAVGREHAERLGDLLLEVGDERVGEVA